MRRCAFRQISLTPLGRSAALLIGSISGKDRFTLTVTAATVRPVQVSFAEMPAADALRDAILQAIPDQLYHDDIHGKPAWRKAMTLRLAEQIRGELHGEGEGPSLTHAPGISGLGGVSTGGQFSGITSQPGPA